ncbi:MAG TPA: toxin-antitoxin system TumE family protein [Candidatus Wunengus sp. YC63]|uniref:toxin-antitoxin system TumE family protein n=1 Tax=unclassified Candidatus Wunengus TaxID=3367695 RepID=UPI0040278E2E
MHGIISALKESNLFSSIDVIDFIDEISVRLINIRAKFLNRTILYITELHTMNYQKYSYHWQREDGELIVRWDNKPHWKALKTFPYHKHEQGKVLPSHRVNVDDVIEEIKEKITRNSASQP